MRRLSRHKKKTKTSRHGPQGTRTSFNIRDVACVRTLAQSFEYQAHGQPEIFAMDNEK